jgi:hypothetical protein
MRAKFGCEILWCEKPGRRPATAHTGSHNLQGTLPSAHYFFVGGGYFSNICEILF